MAGEFLLKKLCQQTPVMHWGKPMRLSSSYSADQIEWSAAIILKSMELGPS
jgi:hypothetical protein